MKKRGISKKEIFGTLLVLMTAIISGFSIIANKFFVASIDPLLFTALRSFFIGIIFFGISLYFYKKNNFKKLNKTPWKNLLLIGIIGGGFAFWLFFSGLKLTLGSRAAFLHKTLPIYACILGFIFLKEKITKKQLIAISIMLSGLLAMQLTKLSLDIRIGDFLVLGATILWAVENVISKKVMNKNESNWIVTFSRMFFGSLILFAIIFLTQKTNLIFSLTKPQLIYILFSGIFLFLYVLTWYWGLKYINLSKASTILLLAPVVSLIFGVLWLKESVSILQLIGSILILFGAYIIVTIKSEKRIKEI
ncbi:MAG: DMT family transporter [Candidatus Pacearchaeota archaeon]|jgi:drug/metabolite transporter (DMT)-like permease